MTEIGSNLSGNHFTKLHRVLSDARNLKDLPSLEGCVSLETLRMDRASLSNVPSDLCLNSPRLKSL